MSDVKEKLAKILQLARKGVGGEKTNAQSLLEKLLKKHGLDLSDIEDCEVKVWKTYKYSNKDDLKLLKQIYANVLNATSLTYNKYKHKRAIELEASELDHIEISEKFRYHKKLLQEEIQRLYIAFVQKHDLGVNVPSSGESSQLDLAEIEQIMRMMRGLKKSEFISTRKRLETVEA